MFTLCSVFVEKLVTTPDVMFCFPLCVMSGCCCVWKSGEFSTIFSTLFVDRLFRGRIITL